MYCLLYVLMYNKNIKFKHFLRFIFGCKILTGPREV